MPRSICSSTTAGLLLAVVLSCGAQERPRLVLQITVDALRGDLVHRYDDRFGPGGFRYLFEHGVDYANAHYQHANTETVVGHASLATGAPPAAHGMVANAWFDRVQGRLVYNIEDADYRLLTPGADVDKATEIDPTQKAAKVEGRSPSAIVPSTFGDELAAATAGRAKIFAVSIKDRGAVTLAGHAGKAFWFAKSRGEFVTSTYYYAGYPAWVDAWNTRKPAGAFAGQQWTLLDPVERYAFGATDDRAYEMDFPGFGRTFPHAYGAADDKYFTTRLTLGPAGDALTLDFAKALIEHEGLGQDAVPDYLAISFSSTDYVGHLFGASSLEMEDNLRRLDRVLADLFAYVDSRIGLDHVLIVLSADHGQPEIPGYLHELGVRRARHFDPSVLEHAPGIVALKEKLGLGDALIKTYFPPYLYLDRAAIQDKGLDLATVERELATALMNVDGIAAAVSSSALQANTAPDTPLVRAARKNYYPGRSGDIYLVFDPEVFVNDFDGLKVPSVHGSPWRYDTYVPVMFAAAGLAPRRVYRPVTPYDIAPTLAALLGISPPSAATGQPLVEVIER